MVVWASGPVEVGVVCASAAERRDVAQAHGIDATAVYVACGLKEMWRDERLASQGCPASAHAIMIVAHTHIALRGQSAREGFAHKKIRIIRNFLRNTKKKKYIRLINIPYFHGHLLIFEEKKGK